MAAKYMTSKPVTAPRSIGRQLNFAAATASAVCNAILEPHGLSLAQWAVLSSIWRNGPLGVKELSRLTGNASPATSRIVERMVLNGLLVRSQNANDRRAVTVMPSEKGEALRHLQTVYEQVNDIVLSSLKPEDAATLFDLLVKVETGGRDWLTKKR